MCAEQDPAFETIKDVCGGLSDYSISARYPDHPEIEEADASLALKETDRIYTFCAALVPSLRQGPSQSPEQSM
jgi:hypothetical protein